MSVSSREQVVGCPAMLSTVGTELSSLVASASPEASDRAAIQTARSHGVQCKADGIRVSRVSLVADGPFSGGYPIIVCLAIVCHGHVAGGRHLPHFLPSVAVGHGEDPQSSANRLAVDFLLDINNHSLTVKH